MLEVTIHYRNGSKDVLKEVMMVEHFKDRLEVSTEMDMTTIYWGIDISSVEIQSVEYMSGSTMS